MMTKRDANDQMQEYLEQYAAADKRAKDAIAAHKSYKIILGHIRQRQSVADKMSALRKRNHHCAAAMSGNLIAREIK